MKKIIKISAIACVIIFTFFFACYIWLGTDSALNFFGGQAIKILHKQGLKLEYQELSGKLPNEITLKEAVLSDEGGILLKSPSLYIYINPWALLHGTLHIKEIDMNGLQLIRRPERKQKEEKSFSGKLPVWIRLDRLSASGASLHPAFISPHRINDSFVTFQLQTAAAIEDEKINLSISGSLTGNVNSSAIFKVNLSPSDGAPDALEVDISLQDDDGRLLYVFSGQETGSCRVDIKGGGPLKNWKSTADIDIASWGRGQAQVALKTNSGSLWQDFISKPKWNLNAAGHVHLVNSDYELAYLGPDYFIKFDAGRQGKSFQAKLDATTGLKNEKNLRAAIDGLIDKKSTSADIEAQWKNSLQEADTLDFAASIITSAESLEIKNANLNAQGLNIEAALNKKTTGQLKTQITGQIDAGAPLMLALWRIAQIDEIQAHGIAKINGLLEWKNFSQPAIGSLEISSADIQWPMERLNSVFGGMIKLSASLTGGQGSYYLTIYPSNLGQSILSGSAAYSGNNNWLDGEFNLNINAGLQNIGAVLNTFSGPVSLNLAGKGRLADGFKAVATFKSEELKNKADFNLNQLLGSIEAEGRLSNNEKQNIDAALKGSLRIKSDWPNKQQISAKTDWSINKNNEKTGFSIKNMSVALPGVSLKAHASLGDISKLSLFKAEIDAKVDSWLELSQLSGLEISGAPSSLEVKIGNDENNSAVIKINSPSLKLKQDRQEILSISKLQAELSMKDIARKEGLNLKLSSGAGAAGSAKWSNMQLKAQGPSLAGDFSAQVNGLRLLNKNGAPAGLLTSNGNYDFEKRLINVNIFDFSMADSRLKLTEAMRVNLNDGVGLENIHALIAPDGELKADVHFKNDAMKIDAALKRIKYQFFAPFVPAGLPEGQLEYLNVKLAGGPQGPVGEVKMSANADFRSQGINIKPSVVLNAHINGGMQPVLKGYGKLKAAGDGEINFDLPLANDGALVKPKLNGPLKAQLSWHGDAASLWRLSGQPDRLLSGQAKLNTAIKGSIKKPAVSADFQLNNGRYTDKVLGLLIANINFKANLKEGAPLEASLNADDAKGGVLQIAATISKDFKTLKTNGRLNSFAPLNRDDMSVALSGTLDASGPLMEPLLQGDIKAERGELNLAGIIGGTTIRTLKIGGQESAKKAGGPKLDIKLSAPNQLLVKGFGLDSEWKMDLHAGGRASQPSLTGHLAPVRGYFEIFSKQFHFSGGEINFTGGQEIKPDLNLELSNTGPNITALIHISGNPDKPALKLDSRPSLPQDEILSQVLFGKSINNISRMEALQLANGLRELSSMKKGSWNPVDSVRKSLGLDVLRLGGSGESVVPQGDSEHNGEDDGIALEAGRYINDDIYVGLEHSPSGGTGVRMEVELTPSISLEGRSSTQSSQVGLGWKRDY